MIVIFVVLLIVKLFLYLQGRQTTTENETDTTENATYDDRQMRITTLVPYSIAALAGVRVNDVLLAINNVSIRHDQVSFVYMSIAII